MGFVPLSFYTNFLVSRAEECGLAQGKVCGGDNRGLEAFLFHQVMDGYFTRISSFLLLKRSHSPFKESPWTVSVWL
jgi:hypothetical protein